MIVSNCPRCAEVFRVPDAEMPDDAYAECPWCKETFPIVEVLHRLPPVLHIISADGESLDFSRRESVLAGGLASPSGEGTPLDQSEYYDGGIGTLADDESDDLGNKTVSEETVAETWTDVRTGADDSSVGDFDVEDPNDTWEEGGQAGEVRAVAPMKVTPAPVVSRKSRGSSTRTWISIVLGGLAAAPLAVAILWVLTLFGVDVDLGFWPLNGHSAVVNVDRLAADPVALSDDQEPGPTSPGSTTSPGSMGRSLSGRDLASSPTDSMTAGDAADSSDREDTADAALREMVEDSSLADDENHLQANVADTDGADGQLPDESVMPDEAATAIADQDAADATEMKFETPPEMDPSLLASDAFGDPLDDVANGMTDSQEDLNVGSPTLDANDAITMPPRDAGEIQDSADAEPRDVVDAGPTLPSTDDGPATLDPDLPPTPAADVALEEPKQPPAIRAAPGVEPASGEVETTAGRQPKRPDQPAVVETANADPIATNAAIDSQRPAAKIEPDLKSNPKVQSESAELVQASDAARDLLDQLSSLDRSDGAKERLLQRDAYIAIANVGAVAGTDSESARTLLSQVKSAPDLNLWSQNTSAWLNLGTRRPNKGVLLVGKPVSNAGGQRVAISDDLVVSLTDESVRLPESARVLGLGRIVGADSERTISLVAVEPLP